MREGWDVGQLGLKERGDEEMSGRGSGEEVGEKVKVEVEKVR